MKIKIENILPVSVTVIGSIAFAFTLNYIDDVFVDDQDQETHYHINVQVYEDPKDESVLIATSETEIDTIPPTWKMMFIPGTKIPIGAAPPEE